MATIEELSTALINADKAGDADAARTLAAEIARMQNQSDPRNGFLGKADAFMRGAADTMSLGFADEIAAGLGTGFGLLGDYGAELARQRGVDASDSENRTGYRIGGQLTGALTGGAGLARRGLSATANAMNAGKSLGRVAAAGAGEGAALGGIQGFGSAEGGADERAKSAALGSLLGSGAGAGAPYLTAGISTVGGAAAAPVLSRLFPENYAAKALGKALERSGNSADDIAAALMQSRAAGQDMFTTADAMGHTGERLLSTLVRNPNDQRQALAEALQGRQLGQGERLASYLAEGFGAPDTAAQRAASLTATRNADAAVNYGAARSSSGTVDPSAAIAAADNWLTPGATSVMSPQSGIADDSIEAAVRRARSYLTDGRSVLSDFSASMRAKQELDAMIEGAKPAAQRALIPIRNELDKALEAASPDYAAARNAFRQQSQAIDAVETGRAAASPRMRAADTTSLFAQMTPEQQQAFRAGYADPLISRIEAASISPTTNKARMLMTEKSGQEFPAFAAPGKADELGDRIAREQRMFQTANAALGGSKTADNLADAADLAAFDPSILGKLFQGRPVSAAMQAAAQILTKASGTTSPGVSERLAKVLMETNPGAARAALSGAGESTARQRVYQAELARALLGLGAAGGGRAGPP